jgi:restriction system protein
VTLWVVKGGDRGEREDYNQRNGVSTLGWSQLGDLEGLDSGEIREMIRASLPERPDRAVSNWAGQVFSFASRIESGDLIAMPLRGLASVMLGEVDGDYRFDPGILANNREIGPHLRQVSWTHRVAQADLGDDLLRSLGGGQQTVFQPRVPEAENMIRAVLAL